MSAKLATGGRLNLFRAVEGLRGPVIQVQSPTIKSESGNGDEFINPGEEFSIHFIVTNSGNETASGVSAELTIPDHTAPLQLVTPMVTIGNIDPGETQTAVGGLRVQATSTETLPLKIRTHITLRSTSHTTRWTEPFDVTIYATGKLSGTVVRHGTGAGVADAIVHYVGPVSGSTITDAEGRFDIAAVNGTYDLRATAAGLIESQIGQVTTPAPDLRLAIGSASVSLAPSPLNVNLQPGSHHRSQLSLRHTGDTPSPIDYRISFGDSTSDGGIYGYVNDASKRIVELDPATGSIRSTKYEIPLYDHVLGLAADREALWLLGTSFLEFKTTLKRIDPNAGEVSQQTELAGVGSIVGFTADSHGLLVASNNFLRTELLRIDPQTGESTSTQNRLPNGVQGIAAAIDRNSLYVATSVAIEERHAETMTLLRTLPAGNLIRVNGLAYSAGSLFVLGHRWNPSTFGLESVLEKRNPDSGN